MNFYTCRCFFSVLTPQPARQAGGKAGRQLASCRFIWLGLGWIALWWTRMMHIAWAWHLQNITHATSHMANSLGAERNAEAAKDLGAEAEAARDRGRGSYVLTIAALRLCVCDAPLWQLSALVASFLAHLTLTLAHRSPFGKRKLHPEEAQPYKCALLCGRQAPLVWLWLPQITFNICIFYCLLIN